ncbi:hypothetical protein [Spiroplasma endosymbiont of Aspidapion aeneum]|uniref:hypothetical protein n=1 Tax=Spiroplasma endosymbiont of Aspidapion aeneum TaxID=3066276 RepID=UPI00313B386F
MNKISKRQGLISLFFSTITSLINAVVQFLIIYFILKKYGSAFNGFVRLTSTFSFFLSTADSALGVATTLLLVTPINKKDWITANELYSTAKKNYRKGAFLWILISVLVSVSYCLFISFQSAQQGYSHGLNIKLADLKLTGTYNKTSISIYYLVFISLIYSFRNILLSLFFNVYENILSAVNKGGIVKIAILISELTCFIIMLSMLNMNNVPIIVVFMPIFMIGIIRGFLVYFYARRECPWLKFYKEFNSFKLNVNSKKISFAGIGQQVILNTDIIILVVLIGLKLASTLSLYLLVAINTKIIMKGFIVSFREYFIVIVSRYGRINWKSYCKYELYSILVAGFAFINLAILLPYFVSALYAPNILNGLENGKTLDATKYILFGPTFSFIYALTCSVDIFNESQGVLINAKGRGQEVSKFQLTIGTIYFFSVIMGIFIFDIILDDPIRAILFMYIFKLVSLSIISIFLYRYTWKYIAYNSEIKDTLINLFIICVTIIATFFVQSYVIDNLIPVEVNTVSTNEKTPHLWRLVTLFFICLITSIIFLISISITFSFEISSSIISSIFLIKPIIDRIFENRKNKRIKENNLEFFEPESSEILINYNNNYQTSSDKNDKKVYVIKG